MAADAVIKPRRENGAALVSPTTSGVNWVCTFMRISSRGWGEGPTGPSEPRHPYPADIPTPRQEGGVQRRRREGAKMNKAVGGVSTPTALPAPDIKLAYAIRSGCYPPIGLGPSMI